MRGDAIAREVYKSTSKNKSTIPSSDHHFVLNLAHAFIPSTLEVNVSVQLSNLLQDHLFHPNNSHAQETKHDEVRSHSHRPPRLCPPSANHCMDFQRWLRPRLVRLQQQRLHGFLHKSRTEIQVGRWSLPRLLRTSV